MSLRRAGLAFTSVLAAIFSGCVTPTTGSTENVGSTSSPLQVCGQSASGPVQGYDISDVASSQKNFDWAGAKANDGISFGYGRISYGVTIIDSEFEKNWQNLKAAGLVRGAYQYFLPNDDIDAQANLVISKVGKLGAGDLPVQFDVEPVGSELGGLSGAQMATKMHRWLDLVEAGTGKRPYIYSSTGIWSGYGIAEGEFAAYPLWIANYGPPSGCPTIPDGWTNWGMWQYSDGNGKLDHDVFNGTLADLQAFAAGGSASLGDDYPPVPRKSASDIDGDGKADVCARGILGIACVLSQGSTFAAPFKGPAWTDDTGWLPAPYEQTIQFGDIDGDGKADICGRSPSGVVCQISTGTAFGAGAAGPAWTDTAGWSQASSYATMQFADIDGDGKQDLCGRDKNGVVCEISDGKAFPTEVRGPAWSDDAGWNRPDQYATMQFADIDGDGKQDLCGRDKNGVVCEISNGTSFPTEVRGPAWSNDASWNKVQYGSTIRFVDVDGDGRADVCGRGPNGITCAVSKGTSFAAEVAGPAWSDAAGWDKPEAYQSIQWGDIDGDKKTDVCAHVPSGGVTCFTSQSGVLATTIAGPAYLDTSGFSDAKYYVTIALGDVDHDGKDDLCARRPDGYWCAISNGQGFAAPFIANTEWADASGWDESPYYESITLLGHPGLATYVPPPPGTAEDGGVVSDDGGSAKPLGAGGGNGESSGCAAAPSANSTSNMASGALAILASLVARRRRKRSCSSGL